MKTLRTLAVMAAAATLLCSCEQNECKFNAKEYAERKTEKLDKIVELDDAQEKAVYAIYLKEGKHIQKYIKESKKEKCDAKHPDHRGPKCDKPCAKKAECDKPCAKPCDKKAECKEAPKCDKPCAKKAECDKPCAKPCDKKAECKEAPKCYKPAPRHGHFANREAHKAFRDEVKAVLTPEQQEALKEHFKTRRERAHKAPKCCPTPQATECNK